MINLIKKWFDYHFGWFLINGMKTDQHEAWFKRHNKND